MNIVKVLLNLTLGLLGGIIGNILAAWILQDIWKNVFTLPRIAASIISFVGVYLILALIDFNSNRSLSSPSTVSGNIQIGNPLIRVIVGTNVIRNIQIGSGRIEVANHKGATNDSEKKE